MVIFFVVSWEMSLFMVVLLMPAMIFLPLYTNFNRTIHKKISDQKAAATNVSEESLGNIRTVKAFATEDYECRRYQKHNDDILVSAKK